MWLPAFCTESPERRKQRVAAEHAYTEKLLTEQLQPWSPSMKWKPELVIDATTYSEWLKGYLLFGGKPDPELEAGLTEDEKSHLRGKLVALSPSRKYAYTLHTLHRGSALATFCGSRKGDVRFNGDVAIPLLLDLTWYDYRENVWMSLTPMEILTLRTGTRKATGCVVVAGLGLGYQLIEVSRKRSVKQIIVVEKDRELADWLMPEICKLLGSTKVDLILGDANEVLPRLQADVALIDIDRGYGSNTFWQYCPNISTIWVWGGANVKEDGWW